MLHHQQNQVRKIVESVACAVTQDGSGNVRRGRFGPVVSTLIFDSWIGSRSIACVLWTVLR